MNTSPVHRNSNIGCLSSKIVLPASIVALIALVYFTMSKNTPSSDSRDSRDAVTQLFKKLASEQEGLLPSILFFKEHRKEVQDFVEKFMAENVTMDKGDDVLTQDLWRALQKQFPVIKKYPKNFALSFASLYEISLEGETRHTTATIGTAQYLPDDDRDNDGQWDGYEDVRITHQFPSTEGETMRPWEALFKHYESVQKYLDEHIDDIETQIRSSSEKWEELSEIEFLSALVNLFPGNDTLQGYIIGDFTIQREKVIDRNWRPKIRIYFSVPYRKDEPYIIEISPPRLTQA